MPPLPPAVTFDGVLWRVKSEFHVTLIGSETVKRFAIADVRKFARGLRFEVTLADEYWRVDEDEASTIVRMCEVAGAEELVRRVEAEVGVVIDRMPLHVTLYTRNTSKGIGLYSRADLERMGRRVDFR